MRVSIVSVQQIEMSRVGADGPEVSECKVAGRQLGHIQPGGASPNGQRRAGGGEQLLVNAALTQTLHQPESLLLAAAPALSRVHVQYAQWQITSPLER